MNGILLVGEDNPYGADPRFALYHKPRHASGNRLRQHLGLRDVTYERLRKINLCANRWHAEEARRRAAAIRREASPYGDGAVMDWAAWPRAIILLGAKVRGAFGFEATEFFSVVSEPKVVPVFVVLPHPSGRNRLWNQPGARESAQAVLRKVAPGVPWGEINPAATAGSDG